MENVKRVFVILMAAVALCASGQTDRPKLIVGLVVDQMRWDYLRCNNTIIDYVPTVTAAGHATIYSGTTPAFHGIAGNNFMLNGKNVTSVQDDSERGVGGNDKTRGKSPRNLITTNLADQLLLATDFKSRTVGIALKDRAAILPAGHRPIGAYWYDKGSASFVTSTYYRDKLPKWVSDFNKKHHDEIASDVYNLPIGTTLTFALAEQALINEQLGQGEATDLLAISVSNTDMCSHYYGTHSPKVDSIYYQLDREIAHFIEVLDQRIGRGNYLLFLSADHGGTHSYPRMTSHGLPSACWYNPEALTAANQVLKQQFGVDSLLKAEMEYTFYLNQEVIDGARLDRDQVMRAACQALEQPEEIQWAIDVSRIDTYPIPSILKERIKLGYFPERSGEIYIVPRTGVYAGKTEWDGSNHGTWSQSDSHIPLIFMGWHIPAGETNRLTHMTDIAATICAMLHIQSPNGCIGMPIFE